ncbi:MAG: hypothetical protein D4R95_07160 [Actinobacteria bacterium]|nr:MAG: hypothetical protein D4R95_07160 [Actinomycetota bacterium]
MTGVLAAGALAFTVNTSVLDNAVTTSEAAPALQADVIALSNFTPSAATTPVAAAGVESTVAAAAGVEPTVAAQSTYNIDGIAAITLALNNNQLSAVSVTPVNGYTFVTTAVSNSRIAVALTSGTSVMTFHAEVLDGRIVTSVVAKQPRISSAAPTTRSHDDEGDDD